MAKHYACIIIDESESCLYQLSSSTVTRFEAVTEAFERVVRSSTLCIWADAFLSDRTLVVARQLDPGTSALLVHNTHVSDKRQAQCVGRYKQAKPKLLAAATSVAAQGKRNVVVSSSKELAYEIGAALGWPYQRGKAAPVRPEGPCLLLTGDSSDATKTLMEDVKGLLDGRAPEEQPYQHFVYTSALTVGVNFDTESRFDNLFLYSSAASACVRDLMQSLKRVRHVSDNTLYYSTYPRYFGDKHFDIFSRERLMRIIDGQEDYLCNNKLLSISGRMPSWMKNLWVFNTQEDNVSAFMHESLLQAYLKATGYTIGQSLVEDADMRECLPTNPPAYEQIDDVDEVGFYLLTDHLEQGRASSKDKVTWMKGHFQRCILRDCTAVDADTCSRMFSVWSADQLGVRTRLRNLSTEQCIATGGTWEQAGAPIFQDNKKQKLDAVRDIMALLNLSASYAIGEALTEAVLEQSAEKVLAMRKDLQETFRLRFRESSGSKKSKTCRALEVVNQVLERWGFTQIRLGSRKKKNDRWKAVQHGLHIQSRGEHWILQRLHRTWQLVQPLHKTTRLLAGVLAGVVRSGTQSYEGHGVSHSCHLIVNNLASARPCRAPWRFWCSWPCMAAAALWTCCPRRGSNPRTAVAALPRGTLLQSAHRVEYQERLESRHPIDTALQQVHMEGYIIVIVQYGDSAV